MTFAKEMTAISAHRIEREVMAALCGRHDQWVMQVEVGPGGSDVVACINYP
jgi:hypothetical protein